MRNPFNEIMQKLRAQRVRARRYTAMLLVLAMLTSLSVSWRLHQVGTALTTDNEYSCGMEEHVHTDDCYTEELVCGYEEGEPEDPDSAFSVDSEPTTEGRTGSRAGRAGTGGDRTGGAPPHGGLLRDRAC